VRNQRSKLGTASAGGRANRGAGRMPLAHDRRIPESTVVPKHACFRLWQEGHITFNLCKASP
jgi:hypothetical protein